jgi:hypothetical protein
MKGRSHVNRSLLSVIVQHNKSENKLRQGNLSKGEMINTITLYSVTPANAGAHNTHASPDCPHLRAAKNTSD